METKSDLFACCKHICKMWWFFCTLDFYVCVLALGPCLLACVETSCFLTFDRLEETVSVRSPSVVFIIFMNLKPLGS